ncbi:hypothetical protein CW731_05715 [Polaribacter sp. ALD11]|uniref:hypothetical protein n=1 Tax=Polaribacter sp. ALD11 TaxID=2058137 RepID=UPI000C3001F5|nr:hypothetical protein [Polaribacter sp. ALD11]AUC84820.1 hypothetical protein CW731_05715 [Polaribacter sp. ALD11]
MFISGLPNGITSKLIEEYAEKNKYGTVPLNKKIEDLFERFYVYFIKVENGNFPDELKYDYDQEILGKTK